jgi:AcrR family transcriptional regulator
LTILEKGFIITLIDQPVNNNMLNMGAGVMSPRSEETNQQIREDRREEILQAALLVFARRGLAATKISDIAEAAGLSHGLIYHYFKSKDEIYTELVRRTFDISTGIFGYAAQSPGDPWERIRMMTETVLAGGYQGDSPYYFLLAMQVFTSEAVPEEVKKIMAEKVPLYTGYLIPLLVEGQKTGQIAAGDPLVMSTAYFSLIQGLAVMKMQMGEEMPIPSADIILRLFRAGNEQAKEIRTTTPIIPGKFRAIKPEPVYLVYQTKTSDAVNPVGSRVRIYEDRKDAESIYRIEEVNENDEKTVILVRAKDWRPISIRIFDKDAKQVSAIEYQNDTVTFDIPARHLKKTQKLKGEYYDLRMISYLFQAFPFGQGEKIPFNLVTDGRGGSPVGSYAMYAQEIGREQIEVPAGNFDCYKLELGIGGTVGTFAAKYKFYFWYTVDVPHRLVRFEDRKGMVTVLNSIENNYGVDLNEQ